MPRTELIRVTADPKPSIWSRMAEVVRSYTIGPLTSRSPELAKYFSGGGPSSSGISVTEHSATSLSAVWAAVGLIADDVSSLPLMLYKRLPNGGKDKFEDHPLYRLLHDEPNPEMGSMVFRRTLQTHASIWQNAYAEIERDQVGRPIALWPLVPESVRVERNLAGVVQYVVSNASGTNAVIPAADMIHLVGRSHDGTVGSTIVEKARESLGLALAAEQFGATFFGNGATFGGVVSFKGPKPPEMSDETYRASLEARHQGVKRAHKILALYNDASFTQIGVPPDNAQFLETRTFQIREVARWFKIPPHKLADLADATFSNVEQMNTEYFVSAIRPWLVLWEQELGRKLIARLERRQQFIEHSIEGFLRGDSTARASFYTSLFNIGAITINEVRGYENLDPLDGGDQAFVQVNNLMPLAKVADYADAVIEAQKASSQKPDPAPQPPSDGMSQEMKAALVDIQRQLAEQGDKLASEAAARAVADAKVADLSQQTDSLQRDIDAKQAEVELTQNLLRDLEARHESELADQVGKTAAQIQTLQLEWEQERAGLMDRMIAAQGEKNDLDVMLSVAEKERDAAKREADTARERETALTETVATVTRELEQARAAIQQAEAVSAELRQQLDAQRETAERLARSQAETEAKRVLAEAQAEERAAALLVERAEREASRRDLAQHGDRLQAITQAHRALIMDAIERLLQRESDRARKAQATPEKLRAWIESFYPLHGETCRSVLRPVVLAWAPCAGVNAEQTLQELVQEHIETSRRELRLAADTEDADELAANLARVLRRWDTERAGSVADRLLAEGDRYGH